MMSTGDVAPISDNTLAALVALVALAFITFFVCSARRGKKRIAAMHASFQEEALDPLLPSHSHHTWDGSQDGW